MAGAMWARRLRNVVLVVLAGLLMASCGEPGSAASSAEVACSINGSIRFPMTFLEGPEYSRTEFINTEAGGVLETFFIGGEGERENQQYLESDGFSRISKSLVIGYMGGLPISYFNVEGDDIGGWGGCRPNLVSGDLVAYRWQSGPAIDTDSSVVPIVVEGGGCVTGDETKIVTEVQSVDVVESPDRVEITVWVRELSGGLGCAGVGVSIDAEVNLAEPLGSRILIDAGLVPPTEAGSQ